MRGKYSKNKFFQQFPQIIQIYFKGSEITQPEDVQKLFKKAEMLLNSLKEKRKKEDLPIIMVLFDELGLAESSKSNPLKVLYKKLEYTGKEEGVSFVAISNYSLEATKIDRAYVLSVPDLDQNIDDLIQTSKNIVESISYKLKKEPIFEIISKTYFKYKNILHIIKELTVYKKYSKNINKSGERENRVFESIKRSKKFIDLMKKENKIIIDFHGNRDFYSLIRGIAIELKRDFTYTDK